MSFKIRSYRWLALVISFALLIGLSAVRSTYAQTSVPTATPDISATITSLQGELDLRATEIAVLNDRLEVKKESLQIDAAKQLQDWLVAAAIINGVGLLLGLGSVSFFFNKGRQLAREIEEKTRNRLQQSEQQADILIEQARQKTEERLNLAIYRVDPTYRPIHIPIDNFDSEARRLQLLGFQNLRPYEHLSPNQLKGIVIHRADTLKDVELLESFIKSEHAKPDQVAFIIYTPGPRIDKGEHIYSVFDNVTFANNAVTIATHIYAVARALVSV